MMDLDQSLVIANIMAGGPGSGRKAECSHCGAQVKMSDGKIGQHSSKYHGEVIDDKCPGSGKAPGHNVVKADAEFATTQVQGKKKIKADVDVVPTSSVSAGGPGSGRKATMSVGNKYGYHTTKGKYKKSDMIKYVPTPGGGRNEISFHSAIHVNDDGSWEHGRKSITTKGQDAKSLAVHLKNQE